MPSSRDIRAGRAYVELGVNDKIAAGLKKAAAKLKSFGAVVRNVGVGMAGIGAGILAPLGLAVRTFSNFGDEINKASGRTGIAVESLSALSYAADQSGSSLEELEAALKKMSRTITDAAAGSKGAQEALAALGLSIADLQRLSPDEQFRVLGDRLSRVTDATTKAAVAQELFGRAGTRLLPLLNDGADGIRELERRARELGVTIGQEDADAATRFGDILDDLWTQAKAVTFHLGAAVARALQPFAEAATRAMATVIEWVQVNRGLAVTIAALGTGLAVAGVAVTALGLAIQGLGVVLGTVAAGLGVVASALGALLSPIGLTIAALAALTAWFLTTTRTGATAIQWLGDRFNELADVAREAFGGIADALAAGEIQLAAEILWTGLKLLFSQGTQSLQNAWSNFKAGFVQTASDAFFGVRSLWVNVAAGLESAWEHTVGFFAGLWEGFVGTFTDLWENAVNLVLKGLNLIKELFDESFDADAANAKLDEALAGKQQDRRAGEVGREAGRQSERDASLARIEAERQATLDELEKRRQEINNTAVAKAEGEQQALEQKIADLRKQLAEQRSQAGAERRRVNTEGGPGVPAAPSPDDLDLEGIAKSLKAPSSVGTFNAAAISRVFGAGQLDTIAEATKRTAKNTDKMLREGGLTWT
jgi:hypothetical protein